MDLYMQEGGGGVWFMTKLCQIGMKLVFSANISHSFLVRAHHSLQQSWERCLSSHLSGLPLIV